MTEVLTNSNVLTNVEVVYTQLNENLRSLTSTFFNWYAFFWTLNLAALAFLYTKDLDRTSFIHRKRIAMLFGILNILGTATSIAMIPTTQSLLGGFKKLTPVGADWQSVASNVAGPSSFYTYVFIVSAISTFLIGCLWFSLGAHAALKHGEDSAE